MKKVLRKAINPLRMLINDSRFTGIMLIFNTLLSLYLANSVFSHSYKNLWEHEWFPSTLAIAHTLPDNFESWINNFLMAFFFLMAGMEIKRELISGELSSFKKAALPFGAAVGGMAVPALIFLAFNINSSYQNGWGIPTATDIAFSIGIASLLGKRIPVGLKILLMALAIIDDLGAIVVIALFYGGQVNWLFFGAAAILYASLFVCNYYFKIKFGIVQTLISLGLWYCFYNSGIEASIVGVLVAFATPVATLPKIEHAIHGYVNFLILPLFALANTAIPLSSDIAGAVTSTLGLGIIAGLVIGKPLGIFLFSRLLVALKIATLPKNVEWKQVFGMGTLAGIGFTMSIFTTMLAFKVEAYQDIAKIAIILSVLLSLVLSMAYFMALNVKESVEEYIAEHEEEKSEKAPAGKPALNVS